MDAVTLKTKGDFRKLTKYLHKENRLKKIRGVLEEYGRRGVRELSDATPVDTGKTAAAWRYIIKIDDDSRTASLSFWNDNMNKGVPIALILQYGHGTGTGGWVEGRDYINPVLTPLFEEMLTEVWKEVTAI